MAAVAYPVSLPGPSQASVVPAERRLLSDVSGGPQQARGVQRDYLATQRVEWFFSASDAAVFADWWKVILVSGGAWFAATWPAPQGWVSLVRRFVGAPQWTHLPGGFWRVNAQILIRGRGVFPRYMGSFTVPGYLPTTDDPYWAVTRFLAPYNVSMGITSAAAFGDLKNGSVCTYTGTPANTTAAFPVVGAGASSCYFGGSPARITYPASANFDFTGSSLTIEGWVRFDSVANFPCWWEIGSSSTSRMGVSLASDVLQFYSVSAAGTSAYPFGDAMPLSTFCHVTVASVGTDLFGAVNGNIEYLGTWTNAPLSASNTLTVGSIANSPGSGDYLNGYVDDIRMTAAPRYINP